MEKPLVSIIVPAFNAAQYVANTLDSILDCGYEPMEVVVVDDGSTDDTCERIETYTKQDPRIRLLLQENKGVSYARNHAIREAKGKYILPVDADDLLVPGFVTWAVDCLEQHPEIKVAIPRAEFFGAKTGEWHYREFSRALLARKNMIPATGMYRREEWEKCGGYCENVQVREDWDFWISILKNGGDVVVSPLVGWKYRVIKSSKRIADRKLKRQVVDSINRRHYEFEYEQLGGPLHFHRSWSRFLNKIHRLLHPRRYLVAKGFERHTTFVKALPYLFSIDKGLLLKKDRNEIREIEHNGQTFIVKSFAIPNIINRLVYGFLRSSKAKRSFDYALLLQQHGIGTPTPVAWLTERSGFLFTHSYYVSLKSECTYTYQDVIDGRLNDDVLKVISQVTARLHNAGIMHKDYSRGNILIGVKSGEGVRVELVDLNRMRFYNQISVEKGLQNFFERLPVSDSQRELMTREYCRCRTQNTNERGNQS